ncbi:MAG: HDOD domain-containing protein [Proteobacteria bacterium]|nr:MAG: HDOD domain-containing protein [Pseudomonadota bacterium]
MSDILIARQPIYDRDLQVVGYEVLYRSKREDIADIIDGDSATLRVLANTFLEIGLEDLLGNRPAFINCSRNFLIDENPLHLPVGKAVLEVTENIAPDPEVLQGIRNLASRGYQIALDDFCLEPQNRPLLEVTNYVKFDVIGAHRARILEDAKELRQLGIKLIAEKVESQEDFDLCKEIGFDLFQGYFLCKPRVIRREHAPANELAVMKLMAELQNPDADARDIERIIATDVTLSYRLLRYVNSAFFGLRKKIDSIQRAIVLLGFRNIRTWATVIALSGIEGKPGELLHISLMRARFCELIAAQTDKKLQDAAFTVGLFSVLDALLDLPMREALDPLPLAPAVESALIDQSGPLGQILQCVQAYQRGHWAGVDNFPSLSAALGQAYLSALAWSDQAAAALSAPASETA